METLAWWGIPIASTIVAIIWVAVINRPRPPADPHDSVRDYERFRAALAATSDPRRKRGT